MYALGGLALYWVECQNLRILILRLNANISVWMFRYSEPKHDIEVEYQMLFGCQSEELQPDKRRRGAGDNQRRGGPGAGDGQRGGGGGRRRPQRRRGAPVAREEDERAAAARKEEGDGGQRGGASSECVSSERSERKENGSGRPNAKQCRAEELDIRERTTQYKMMDLNIEPEYHEPNAKTSQTLEF